MEGKSTIELNQGLMSEPNLASYLASNRSAFSDQDITQPLSRLFKASGMSKAELARQAGMSEVYLYQVFSGRRKPSRDRLLCICMGLRASLEEIQQILKQGEYAVLYSKHKRDAIISHGILHCTSLGEINERLFQEKEKPPY